MDRDFFEDLKNSNNPELLSSWKKVIEKLIPFSTFFHKETNLDMQFQLGIDGIIKLCNGRRYAVELKTKRYDYFKNNLYTLELQHHRYYDTERKKLKSSKEGWLYNSTADWVCFGTLNREGNKIIELCIFSLYPFKERHFSKTLSKQQTIFSKTKQGNQLTVNKLVNKDWLKQFAEPHKYIYWSDEEWN